MMRRFAISVAVAGFLLSGASLVHVRPALADNRIPADNSTLPYQIDILKIGGPWDQDGARSAWVMADIEGDGVREMVECAGSRMIGMEAEDGRIKNRWQVNMEPGWILPPSPKGGVAADLDGDGIDEIYTAVTMTDKGLWRFIVVSPAQGKILFSRALPTGPDRRPDGRWDGRYYPQLLLDNTDGRGRPAILFLREVLYDAYPRGLVAVDPFTGDVIWEWLCGPNPNVKSLRPVDLDGQGQGVTFFGNAPDNLGGEKVAGTSDDRGYAFLVSAQGQTLWQREFSPGFASGTTAVADIGGDGRQDIIVMTSSNGTNVPSELSVWDWREDRPLARLRSAGQFDGLVVLPGPREGTNWLIAGSREGLVTRYLYENGALIQDQRLLGNQKMMAVTGAADILPSPGPEILLSVDDSDDFYVLDRNLKVLAGEHDARHRGTRQYPAVWQLQPRHRGLVVGCDRGFRVLDFRPTPLAWGRILTRASLVAAGLALLWLAFLLGRRRGSRQEEAARRSRVTDREALYRLWLELDDVKHERLFEPSKGLRRLVWLLNAFTTEVGEGADLSGRIQQLMATLREEDLPRLRAILHRAEAEQVAPDTVGRTAMVLASASGKLDALAEGDLTVARVQAVQQELGADLEKIEEGFLDLWRTLGDFYTADPVQLLQGLILIREMEFKRAGIKVAPPEVESGPEFLCRIDSSALRYVLGNLLDNAMRAVAGSDRKEIALHVERRDLEVVITVKDTGRGIPEQDRQRIFSGRFSSRGGGQGLFRSREILHRWRGEIELTETSPGGGATFTVVLPAAVKDLTSASLKLV